MGAFQLGFQSEQETLRDRRLRKEALEDEKRQNLISDLHNQQAGLLSKLQIGGLSDEDTRKYKKDLADVRGQINSIYDPIKAPGALQKDWDFLKGLITRHKTLPPLSAAVIEHESMPATDPVTITMPNGVPVTLAGTPRLDTINVKGPPTPPPPRNAYERRVQAARQHAETEAQALIDALPPNLQQQVQSKVAAYKALNPDASAEEIQRMTNELFELGATGAKTPVAPKWIFKSGVMPDGTRVTVKYNEKDPLGEGALTLLDGTPVPPGFKLDMGGKGPKGLKYIKNERAIVDQDDPTKRYNDGDPNNPPEIKKMFDGVHQAEAVQLDIGEKLAAARGSGYNDSKRVPVIDTSNGESVVKTYKEIMDEPGRYIVSVEYDKWVPRANMLEDLRGSSRLVRDTINRVKAEGGFNLPGEIVGALNSDHPKSAIQLLVDKGSLAALTPAQQEYVIATAGMAEQAMGMRSILGAGAGSDDVRNAIVVTLPGLVVPNSDYAIKQLDFFDGTLERVHRMIPSNIKLANNLGTGAWTVQDKPSPYSEIGQGGQPAQAGGQQGGGQAGQGAVPTQPGTRGPRGAKSVSAMKQKYFPDKSDDEIKQILWTNGFGWTN